LLAALPAAAATVHTVQNGIDVWHTAGDGSSFVNFDKNPIPKGFFCSKSAAFTGKVVLQGRPLATGTPGELGGADTIVQRLDDANFDGSGVATTRVQLRALQLVSVAPLKTACGNFNVLVTLNGTQPTTKMKIIRETESSGRFEAPIAVQYKISFIPTRVGAQKLELVRSFTLAPAPNATWGTLPQAKSFSRQPTLLVDTDGDQIPDTYVPRSSGNFQAGWTPAWAKALAERRSQDKIYQVDQPIDCSPGPDPECHPEAEGIHCSTPCGIN
ncbi:MAG TPA: hypothetical protein VLX28_28310, partial [Thermoanaerobaculia bacterium]|nr:hypothetical protein [Thermoanaerobaculia bacterium]